MNKKETKGQHIEQYFCIVLLISVVAFVGYIIYQAYPYTGIKDQISKIDFIGSYEVDGKSEVIKEGMKFSINGNKEVILRGHFSQDIEANNKIFFYMHCMRLRINRNGQEIYRYGYSESHPNIVQSVGVDWAIFYTDGINQTDDIEIVLQPIYNKNNNKAYELFMSQIYIGSRYELLKHQMQKNMGKIIVSILSFIVGMGVLCSVYILEFMNEPIHRGGISCALLLIMISICTFMDYDYITLMINNGFLINTMFFSAELLMCEFLLIYLSHYLMSEDYVLIGQKFIRLGIGVIISYFILQILGKVDCMQMIQIAIPIGVCMLNIIIMFLIRDYKKYADWRIRKVTISSIILGGCIIIEMVHYWVTSTYWTWVLLIGSSIFCAIQFELIFVDSKSRMEKVKRAEKLESELMQNRIAMMISQVQPHFLYNALTSIQELCLIDPNKAQNVLMKFSQFLRGNMDALLTTTLIPLEKELQHIKNYLYIEKIRYGDYLEVVFEIEVTDFLLPALSIQPIVENAVRWGVGKKEEGGTVIIRTRESKEDYKIIVEDDGVGVGLDEMGHVIYQDTKRNHVGLENVKNRLMAQCAGNLQIESKIGEGTKVTITIPKERRK